MSLQGKLHSKVGEEGIEHTDQLERDFKARLQEFRAACGDYTLFRITIIEAAECLKIVHYYSLSVYLILSEPYF